MGLYGKLSATFVEQQQYCGETSLHQQYQLVDQSVTPQRQGEWMV
jgi:hypothetical protein